MTNLLDLNLTIEEVQRDFITIDGERYELATPDDLSVPELRNITRLWKVISEMQMADNLTKKQGDEYENNLKTILRKVAPSLPDEVVEKPNWRSGKELIILSFFVKGAERNPLLRNANLTSLIPLLSSNGSTTETPDSGS